jgi:hypothetical protein
MEWKPKTKGYTFSKLFSELFLYKVEIIFLYLFYPAPFFHLKKKVANSRDQLIGRQSLESKVAIPR